MTAHEPTLTHRWSRDALAFVEVTCSCTRYLGRHNSDAQAEAAAQAHLSAEHVAQVHRDYAGLGGAA